MKLGAGVPLQVPVVAASWLPCTVDPDTVGRAVFVGGVMTTAVAADATADDPPLLLPVTTTVRVEPPSTAATV